MSLPVLFVYLNSWLYLDMSSKTPVCTQLLHRAVSPKHRDNRLSARGHYKLDAVAERLEIERWSDNGLKFMIINTQRSGHVSICAERYMLHLPPLHPCKHTHTQTHTDNLASNAFRDEGSHNSWQMQKLKFSSAEMSNWYRRFSANLCWNAPVIHKRSANTNSI